VSLRVSIGVPIVALCLCACASSAWKAARSADDMAAYSRYLRQYADSAQAPEARERLAMTRVRATPSPAAFEAFLKEFPGSPLAAELRPHVEEQFFLQTRARGTAAAYREFLESFPDGGYAARALGNAEYLEQGGFGARPEALDDFAQRHPTSDYAAEARRSAAGVRLRQETAFRRVGLLIDVPAETPGADRLVRAFSERASAAYAAAALELIPLSGPDDERFAEVAAHLKISHRERPARTRVRGGSVSQPGIVARTEVTLGHPGDVEPIWRDGFEMRAAASDQRPGVSILFGPGSMAYWSDFFVPVATWNTRVALREARSLQKPAVAVEMLGSRAIILFGDGDLQVLDLGDPANPVRLAEYRRARDLSRFEGVAIAGGRIVSFGPDGIEVLRLDADRLVLDAAYGRDVVGSVIGVESAGAELLVAGNRGLLQIDPATGAVHTVLAQEILGLTRSGGRLLFTDGSSLYVSTAELLEMGRLEGRLRMGRRFRPARVRATGDAAVVLGERGVAWVDLSVPAQPRLRSRVDASEVGEVRDAILVGGRLFLLGARGLQIADPSGAHIVDSADVAARRRLGASGRHLVAVGETHLQVVDSTPFLAAQGAASRADLQARSQFAREPAEIPSRTTSTSGPPE